MLADREKIEVNCDFCNKQYVFDAVDAAELFNEKAVFVENSILKSNTAH